MTREELVDSLGTIARSGTRKFAEAMKAAEKDNNLIGQVCSGVVNFAETANIPLLRGKQIIPMVCIVNQLRGDDSEACSGPPQEAQD